MTSFPLKKKRIKKEGGRGEFITKLIPVLQPIGNLNQNPREHDKRASWELQKELS